MKYIWIGIILLVKFNSFGQEILFENQIEGFYFDKFQDQCFIEQLDDNNQALVLLSYNIFSYLLDSNFNLIKSIETKKPGVNASLLLGYSKINNGISLFFTNERKNTFFIKRIGFSNEVYDKIKFPKFKNEGFLESFTIGNKFYFLTVQKNTTILKMRIYDGINLIKEKTFDLPYKDLYASLQYGENPWDLNIQKINPKEYNPIDILHENNKIYLFEDKVVLSFELKSFSSSMDKTILFSINLENLKSESANIFYPSSEGGKFYTNSFLLDSILVQKKTSPDKVIISLKNIKNDSIIQQKELGKEWFTGVSFYSEKRKPFIKKSKNNLVESALKKLSTHGSSVSAYRSERSNRIQISIGAFKGDTYGAFTASTYFSNGSSIAYKLNKVESLFNKFLENNSFYCNITYDNVEGRFTANISDKSALKDMIRFSIYDRSTSTGFYYKKDDYYLYGNFNYDSRKYFLRKFEE